jgi:vitamin B12 transporter
MPHAALPSFAATFLALVLLPCPARAQQSDTTRLPQTVVTATRVPMRADTVPATVTVLRGEDLRARGITRVADALQGLPGIALVQGGPVGAATSLFVRGANSNSVKVLVDGVAVNNPGGAIDLAHLTTDLVDRIEIVRGPASVLYGTDAVAGVVQVFTRAGQGAGRASVLARGGTYGTAEAIADLSGGSASAAWSLGGALRGTDGILAFNNAYRNGGVQGALHLARGTRSDARLTARWLDATYHYPTNGAGAVIDSNAVRDESRLILGLDAGRRLTDRVEARLLVASSDLDARSDDQPDSPGDTLGFYLSDRARIARRSADLRLDARVTARTQLTLGGEWARQQVRSDGESRFAGFPASTASFDEHRTNLAAYAQFVGEGGRGFTWALGARLDDNAAFGTFATARASAGWWVLPATRLRVAVGNAFKEPSFDETFSSSFTIGNAALDPERTRSWEVAAEQRLLAGRVTLGATWFDQRFRDLIQYVSGDASTAFRGRNENLAASTARGLELEGRALLGAGFELGGSVTALHTEVTDAGTGAFGTFEQGEELLRRPARSGAIDVSWTRASRARIDAIVHFVGERDDYDFTVGERVLLPGYSRVDLSGTLGLLRQSPGRPALDLTLRVDNLLDEDYQPILGFPAPGRTVLLGVRVATGH